MKFHRLQKIICLFFFLVVLSAPVFCQSQISGPNTTVPGSQLIFYFDLVASDAGYISIKNTGPSLAFLHIQVIDEDCTELFDFLISLDSFCTRTFDLRHFEYNRLGGAADLIGKRGMVFVTPTTATLGYAALPYNHLVGSIIVANSINKTSFGLNAVSRLAVDGVGNPLADSTTPLDGTTSLLQLIRPKMIHLDHFFALNTVTDSRLAFVSFIDSYSESTYTVTAVEEEGLFYLMAGTEDCAKLSIPNLTYFCILDIPLKDVLGATVAYYNQSSGSLEIKPKSELEYNQNLFGFFFETLGSYASARHLWVTPETSVNTPPEDTLVP